MLTRLLAANGIEPKSFLELTREEIKIIISSLFRKEEKENNSLILIQLIQENSEIFQKALRIFKRDKKFNDFEELFLESVVTAAKSNQINIVKQIIIDSAKLKLDIVKIIGNVRSSRGRLISNAKLFDDVVVEEVMAGAGAGVGSGPIPRVIPGQRILRATSDINQLMLHDDLIGFIEFLKVNSIDINYVDDLGNSILINAAIFNAKNIVKFLTLQSSCNLEILNKEGKAAFDCESEDISNLIWSAIIERNVSAKKFREVLRKREKTNLKPELLKLIKSESFDDLKKFILVNFDSINDKYINGQNLLHIAVKMRNLDLVNFLLLVCADINAENDLKDTALSIAVENGSEEIVKTLVESDQINLHKVYRNGFDVLDLARFSGNANILKLIESKIKSGSERFLDIEYLRKEIEIIRGKEASLDKTKSELEIQIKNLIFRWLIKAIQQRDLECFVSIFKEYNKEYIDVNIKDRSGNSILMYAAEAGHGSIEIVRFLISNPECNLELRNKKGIAAFDCRNDYIAMMIKNQILIRQTQPIIERLKAKGFDDEYFFNVLKKNPHAKNKENLNLLDICNRYGDIEGLQTCIEYGIGRNEVISHPHIIFGSKIKNNLWFYEPDYVSAIPIEGSIEDLQLFMDKNLMHSRYHYIIENAEGINFLMWFCKHGRSDLLEFYLQKMIPILSKKDKIDILNKQDDFGLSAIHHAVKANSIECLKILVKTEAHYINFQELLLDCSKDSKICQFLFEDIFEGGETLLHFAVRKKDIDLVRLLIEKGIDVSYRNVLEESALDIAVQNGLNEIIEIIVMSNPKVSSYNKGDEEALNIFNYARWFTNISTINFLSKCVDKKIKQFISEVNIIGLIQFLETSNLDINHLDDKGNSILILAANNSNKQAEILVRYLISRPECNLELRNIYGKAAFDCENDYIANLIIKKIISRAAYPIIIELKSLGCISDEHFELLKKNPHAQNEDGFNILMICLSNGYYKLLEECIKIGIGGEKLNDQIVRFENKITGTRKILTLMDVAFSDNYRIQVSELNRVRCIKLLFKYGFDIRYDYEKLGSDNKIKINSPIYVLGDFALGKLDKWIKLHVHIKDSEQYQEIEGLCGDISNLLRKTSEKSSLELEVDSGLMPIFQRLPRRTESLKNDIIRALESCDPGMLETHLKKASQTNIIEILNVIDNCGNNLLHNAIYFYYSDSNTLRNENNFILCIEMIISAGVDANARNSRNYSPKDLILEYEPSKESRIKKFFCNLSEVESRIHDGKTVFSITNGTEEQYHYSRESKILLQNIREFDNIELIKFALVKIDSINEEYLYRDNLLHIAAKIKNLDLAKLLLKIGININARNFLGQTALHIAVQNGSEAMIKLLLTHPEISLMMRDLQGFNILELEKCHGNINIIKLIRNKLGILESPEDRKYYAAEDEIKFSVDDVDSVFDIEEVGAVAGAGAGAGADIQSPKGNVSYNQNIKQLILSNDFIGLQKFLAENSISINYQNGSGDSILMLAARAEAEDIVTYLIAQPECQLELRNKHGKAAFDCNNHDISMMIKNQIIINAAQPIISRLYDRGMIDGSFLSLLKKDPHARDYEGRNFLQICVINEDPEALKFCIEYGIGRRIYNCKIESTDSLMSLIAGGSIKNNQDNFLLCIKLLVESCGANIWDKSSSGLTVLHKAVKCGYDKVIKYLLSLEPFPDSQNSGFWNSYRNIKEFILLKTSPSRTGDRALDAIEISAKEVEGAVTNRATYQKIRNMLKASLESSTMLEEECKKRYEESELRRFCIIGNVLRSSSRVSDCVIPEKKTEFGKKIKSKSLGNLSDQEDLDGRNILILACIKYDTKLLDILLEERKALNKEELLLDIFLEERKALNKEELSKKDVYGLSAIHYLVEGYIQSGNRGILKYIKRLAMAGADINAKDSLGRTAVHMAFENLLGHNKKDMCKKIFDCFASLPQFDISAIDDRGLDVSQYLDRSKLDGFEKSVIDQIAVQREKKWMTKPEYLRQDNITELLKEGNNRALKRMLMMDTSLVNTLFAAEETLLHLAVRTKNIKLVSFLIKLGINVDSKSSVMETALFIAVCNGCEEIVDILLQCSGVDLKTPYPDPAMKENGFERISILEFSKCLGNINITRLVERAVIERKSGAGAGSSSVMEGEIAGTIINPMEGVGVVERNGIVH